MTHPIPEDLTVDARSLRFLPLIALLAWPAVVAAAENPGRENAYLLPATPATGLLPFEVDDVVRPPLPGAAVPTDPRDGTRRDRAGDDPQALDLAARALGKVSPQAGGDDVLVAPNEYPGTVKMDIASNGDIYLAMELRPEDPGWEEYIHVYRSQDGGTNFSLWGVIDSPSPNYERLYDINVVEGSVDRVFVTYMYDAGAHFDYRIAYEDLSASTATWTIRTVMDVPGVSFLGPDLADDSLAFSGYYLYAVCAGLDGNGDDIWFSRSTDFGDTWSAPYRIAELTSSGNLMYSRPRVSVGQGGLVHVIYSHTERLQSTMDDGVRYIKATGYAGSAASWGSPLILYSNIDGIDSVTRDLVTSPTSSTVAVFTSAWIEGYNPEVIASYTNGDSWSALNKHSMGFSNWVNAVYDPANGRVVAAGEMDATNEMTMRHTPITDLGAWTPMVNFADVSNMSGSPAVAIDPTRGNRIGVAWRGYLDAGGSFATFDAEWRADDGYPNYDPGFPAAIPSGAASGLNRTAPAIVNLDADPYGEIVFGDVDGNIHVLSHLGTYPGAWPQDIGAMPYRAPVAVGDLNGDGQMAVVAGSTDGKVWAFDSVGGVLPGFPVDLGTDASTYVSIGTVGGPYPRWIFAASGNRMARISYRGEVNFKSGSLNGTYSGPAAIGDVDNDGLAEVVVGYLGSTGNGGVHLYNGDLSGSTTNRFLSGVTVSDAVTLADLDLNGDLEICAPTNEGRMFVLDHDMSDHPGFPFDNGTGAAVTSAHFSQILGSSNPELLFSSRDGQVHIVYSSGIQQTNFPAPTGPGWWLQSSPIATGLQDYSNWITVGSRDQSIYTFKNVGAGTAEGWPRDMGDRIEVSPARSDLDNDGRLELVYVGNDAVHVLDVGAPAAFDNHSWTMAGNDPQRTGCYECTADLATPAPEVASSAVSFRLSSRSPSAGPVSFAATLPGPGVLDLEIFDLRGRRVRKVTRTSVGAGTHTLSFDGRDGTGAHIARGQYFARLQVRGDGFSDTQVQRFLVVD